MPSRSMQKDVQRLRSPDRAASGRGYDDGHEQDSCRSLSERWMLEMCWVEKEYWQFE